MTSKARTRRAAALLLIALLFLVASFCAIDRIEQQIQAASDAAWLAECVARPPLPMTIDGQLFDLNACG